MLLPFIHFPQPCSFTLQISSKELLFWLSSATVIRKILSERGRYFHKQTEFKKRVLPVFILQVPENVEVLFENNKQVMLLWMLWMYFF